MIEQAWSSTIKIGTSRMTDTSNGKARGLKTNVRGPTAWQESAAATSPCAREGISGNARGARGKQGDAAEFGRRTRKDGR